MQKNKRNPAIMDVTVRDGSYAIDYQYTPAQVGRIAKALDEAGIDYMEVSHGCGLGASENIGFSAAASDEEYVRAAKRASRRTKIGVIALPAPVTKYKDIDSIIDDVDFIRFAANCDDPGTVEANLNYALKKRPGLEIFFQLMRSTRLPRASLVKAARQVEEMGAGTVYLVDTAGHFLPEEVRELISALRSNLKIKVGFHGHNNLGLAVANTLAAIDAGASSIDASLKGIGRSGGNAGLEEVISVLKRMGMARKVDLAGLITAGDSLISPIMPKGNDDDAINIITADANIDIYPIELYERIASAARVDLSDLIYALGRDKSTVEVGIASIERALKKLRVDPYAVLGGIDFKPGKK